MLNINKVDGDEVTLAFYAATNIPAQSSTPAVSGAGTADRRLQHAAASCMPRQACSVN